MEPLKLPDFKYQLRGDQIFCFIRKKWITLTPEEWVRQHFLNLLINHLGYPKGLTRLEHNLDYFKNRKRSDIVILNQDGGVHLLVECKSAEVTLDQKVLNQVAAYNKVLSAKYVAITNGLSHFIWEKDTKGGLNQLNQFPVYSIDV